MVVILSCVTIGRMFNILPITVTNKTRNYGKENI
jgi:hypothetical protein